MKVRSRRLHLDQLEDRTVPSSPGDIDWLRQFGSDFTDSGQGLDPARAVAADGSVYVAGDVPYVLPGQTSAGGTDAYLRKYDAAGNELWTRQFGTASSDEVDAIAVDASGVYVVTTGAFVRKYDAAGTELWARQFGAAARALAVDASGVYVAGSTGGNAGGADAYVRKYDAAGNELWTRQFGTASDDFATGVAADASGVYVGGYTHGTLPGQSSAGGDDAFVRKYDAAGNELWTRQFGAFGTERAFGVAADGSGVYVAGVTAGTPPLPGQTSLGFADAFVRKYDAAGNELWTRQFGTAGPDIANGIAVVASGVYVAGVTEEYGGFQTSAGGFSDAFVWKFDASGNEIWAREFGTPGTDDALGVAADASGVYVAGSTDGTLPGGDGGGVFGTVSFVRKYDAAGTELWTRQFGPPTATDHLIDAARAVAADGNVYVAGDVAGVLPGQATAGGFSDVFVREYDAAGNEVWTRQFGTADFEQALAVAVDASGVYVVGYTDGTLPGQTSAGGPDAFVRKYDAAGNELWTRQFGTSGTDSATGIAVTAAGVYVAGSTTGTFPGQAGAGDQDAFVCAYDASGNVLWTRQFDSPGWDQATGAAADASGVYVSGSTAGVFADQAGAGEQDAFVRKYDAAGNVVWTRQFGTGSTDEAFGLSVDSSGVYVVGSTAGTLPGQTSAGLADAFIRKYDLGGTELWTRQFGTAGADQALGVAAAASGVYLTGSTQGTLPGQTSAGFEDAFVRKYDTTGGVLWTGEFGTAAADSAAGVAVGAAGLFVAGSTTGTFPGQTVSLGTDAFVARVVDSPPNTPPSNLVLTPSTTSINENGTVTLNGSFADPDAADTHAVVINWGPGEGATTLNLPAGVTTFAAGHTYPDDNPTGTTSDAYPVTATVTEPAGNSAGGSTTVTVNNVAPAVTVTGPASGAVVTVGTPVALTGAFTDAGTADTHTAGWTVGAVTVAGSLTPGSGGGTVTGSYTFTTPGVYPVMLTVTDDDGGTGSDLVLVTVVRRPTTTAVSVSEAIPLLGADGLTVSAAVSGVAPGSGNPTGTVTFYDGSFPLGTAELVSGAASLTLGSTALAAGPHAIRAVYGGDDGFSGSESTAAVTVLVPSAVQGLVYIDFNNDGRVDFGERAVADVAVTLTGTDDLGRPVERTVRTDADGVYAFVNLRPSGAGGYTLHETQPAGLPDGRDTPGTIDGVPTGTAAADDTFTGVVLPQGGSFAENYNFGERPATTGAVAAGQTATIGFWQNPNGQNLVRSLNGGPTATRLGHWLAGTFPNLYGALDGKTNGEVAAFYKALFARTATSAPGGPPKTDAQVMATALAVYVTNQSLAGTAAAAYGFRVTADGIGARVFNTDGNGAAFGAADNSNVSVMDLLLAVNARSRNGLLYDLNGDGRIDASEAGYRAEANDLFSSVNEAGDI